MSKRGLSNREIEHIAKLAHIGLKDKEIEKFQKHLSDILQYVDQLNEVDTGHVSPTFQVTGLTNIFRDDKVVPSLTQEQTLQNAPLKEKGYFKVKR